MEATGESVQIAARRLRYEWFRELSAEHGYDAIAIAHHADDSIETFFINLMAGTGSRAHRHPQGKRENHPPAALRLPPGDTRLRHGPRHPLPGGLLEPLDEVHAQQDTARHRPDTAHHQSNFTELMGANISRLTDAQLFIDRCIETIMQQAVTTADGIVTIDPAAIDPRMPLNYVIYEIMSSGYGFKGDVVDGLMEALQRGATGRRFYSKDYAAYINRGRIIVVPVAGEDPCETELTATAHKVYCGNSVILARHTDIDNIESLRQPEKRRTAGCRPAPVAAEAAQMARRRRVRPLRNERSQEKSAIF